MFPSSFVGEGSIPLTRHISGAAEVLWFYAPAQQQIINYINEIIEAHTSKFTLLCNELQFVN